VSDLFRKRSLGQHFLADPNILGVIDRLAELDAGDVVVEVGPGHGALTQFLADLVTHVHAIELDSRLAGSLGPLAARDDVSLVWGDALRMDLNALEPAPTKLVANLPYNIATPLVAETLATVPSLQLWCVMVQREAADRFFAAPSTKAYGAVSVVVQLTARRTGFHPVSRTVFRPPPNVDSALVAFRRRALPERFTSVRALIEAAFGHRRKTLANAVSLAGLATREDAVGALTALGRPADTRAEMLSPDEFVALEQALR
jgi:16S rRNA (adenine1518-N6/adenine1519-N6)-dimethyltransferase